uniref:Uncharacterized protein n=1 Tax=Glossina brevipalpis TaxID=37001 RepID=A0A1A9WXB4_9MUSC
MKARWLASRGCARRDACIRVLAIDYSRQPLNLTLRGNCEFFDNTTNFIKYLLKVVEKNRKMRSQNIVVVVVVIALIQCCFGLSPHVLCRNKTPLKIKHHCGVHKSGASSSLRCLSVEKILRPGKQHDIYLVTNSSQGINT